MKTVALIVLFVISIALCIIGGVGTYIGGTILSTLIWVAFMSGTGGYGQYYSNSTTYIDEKHAHIHHHYADNRTVSEGRELTREYSDGSMVRERSVRRIE